jgi:hypothetical protein
MPGGWLLPTQSGHWLYGYLLADFGQFCSLGNSFSPQKKANHRFVALEIKNGK